MKRLFPIPLLLASCGPAVPPVAPPLPTFTVGQSVKIAAVSVAGTTYLPALKTRLTLGEVCTVSEVSPNFSGWYWVKCPNAVDEPLYATMLEVNP